jgi:hypothetical protein
MIVIVLIIVKYSGKIYWASDIEWLRKNIRTDVGNIRKTKEQIVVFF